MIIKIIGAERKTGNFQGRDYDNVVIYYTCPISTEVVERGLGFGERANFMKTKSNILPLEKAFDYANKGTSLEVYFDQYTNPVMFNPVKS